MVNKFSVDPKLAGTIPGMLPFGAIILTPLFGRIYDKIGHGADLMIIGSFMIVIIHTLFAMPFIDHWIAAVILMILLGVAFSMVPSAMWPSLAKIMPERQLGTTYALTFFIQNIGLWGMPVLIGYVLDKYCIIGTHVLAILLAFMVKIEDKKKGYGLQLPNIKK
jgi:MFS family permease